MKSSVSIIIYMLIMIAVASSAFGDSQAKCGKEYRFITKDGIKYQGHLVANTGDTLTLRKGHTIALSDVESAYRVRRNTVQGTIGGTLLGALIGVAMAKAAVDEDEDSFLDFHFDEVIAGGVAGAFIGGVAGGLIGSKISSWSKVKLEMIPLCFLGQGNEVPLALNLTYEF